MVYWGSPNIAHTMVSFGFSGSDYICFSIETRKEKGEGYSAIKGLFRQFELVYVAADERDSSVCEQIIGRARRRTFSLKQFARAGSQIVS